MEDQLNNSVCSGPLVKATFQLGSETYSFEANKGNLSEQLFSVKEQSMSILKEFITKHKVADDVPDDPEISSDDDDDDGETPEKPPVKKRK